MPSAPPTLAAALQAEFRRLIALLPDDEISAFAATNAGFTNGGFRLGKPATLRLRLAHMTSAGTEIPEEVRNLLARRSRVCGLIVLLAPEALAEHQRALADAVGHPALLAAMLLDRREKTRDLARAWLGEPEPPPAPDGAPEGSLARLREPLSLLFASPTLADDSATGMTQAMWQQKREQLDARIRDLLAENRKLRAASDRAEALKREARQSREQADETRKQAEASALALREQNRICEDLTAELAREKTHRETRLRAALDLALAREFHGWLAEARSLDAEVAAGEAPCRDMIERAEAALRRQIAHDRHSGNREQLAERLARLRAIRERARGALANALKPASELKAVALDLDAEIARIAALIEPPAEATPLERALLARIHGADDNALPALRNLPETFIPLGILDQAAIERVRQAFHKRLAAVQAASVPPDPETDRRGDAVTRLGRALAGASPAMLLLDGHNVLFGLPARYNPPRGGARRDADKRKQLADDVARLVASSPAVRAMLVFDGHSRHDEQAAPNVRVAYSGGTGEHRADSVLLDNIRFYCDADPGVPVFLVSNDDDLRAQARRLGALTVDVLDFGAFLGLPLPRA